MHKGVSGNAVIVSACMHHCFGKISRGKVNFFGLLELGLAAALPYSYFLEHDL